MRLHYRRAEIPTPIVPVEIGYTKIKQKMIVEFRVDTGADMTVVPQSIVDTLGFIPYDRVVITDYDSRAISYRTYLVDLRLGRSQFRDVEVVASETDTAYLGLDVLNRLKVTLDGPKRTIVIH